MKMRGIRTTKKNEKTLPRKELNDCSLIGRWGGTSAGAL